MVSFNSIPSNLRVPLFFAELDNSRANSGIQTQRTLIIGQQLTSGTLTAAVPVLLQGLPWLNGMAGTGSMLAQMAEWYRKRDNFGEVWLLPLADAGSSVAATSTLTVTAAPTATGVYALRIAGKLVPVLVSASMTTPTLVATAIAAAVTADTDLPVTAAAAAGVVTLTAKNKGLTGNDIDVRVNYLGSAGGESTPAGLLVTVTAMTGGTTPPVLDTALAAIGDKTFDFIAFPYTDTASLDALKAFLAARWNWDKMLYGGAFAAYRGTLGAATTFGVSRNDAHVCILPYNDSPTPPWLWAANFCGAAAVSLRADPGLPLQTLPLDALPPPVQSRWTIGERNVLLFDGLSSFTVGDDGTVALETIVTSYQKNGLGQPDDSYLYVERLYVLAAVIRDLKGFVTSTFGRMKLATDGTVYAPGSNIVTANVIRDAILGRYRFLERIGLVQEYARFKDTLVVERNASNRCRVDALLPVIPIDQLRQVCGLVQFRNSGDQG